MSIEKPHEPAAGFFPKQHAESTEVQVHKALVTFEERFKAIIQEQNNNDNSNNRSARILIAMASFYEEMQNEGYQGSLEEFWNDDQIGAISARIASGTSLSSIALSALLTSIVPLLGGALDRVSRDLLCALDMDSDGWIQQTEVKSWLNRNAPKWLQNTPHFLQDMMSFMVWSLVKCSCRKRAWDISQRRSEHVVEQGPAKTNASSASNDENNTATDDTLSDENDTIADKKKGAATGVQNNVNDNGEPHESVLVVNAIEEQDRPNLFPGPPPQLQRSASAANAQLPAGERAETMNERGDVGRTLEENAAGLLVASQAGAPKPKQKPRSRTSRREMSS